MSDPLTLILSFAVFGVAGWWLRGFIHKEKESTFKHRLEFAKERQEDLTEKLAAAEAKNLQLESQILAGAPQETLRATAASTVKLLAEANSANVALRSSLAPSSGSQSTSPSE
jgi:hypothetical protein